MGLEPTYTRITILLLNQFGHVHRGRGATRTHDLLCIRQVLLKPTELLDHKYYFKKLLRTEADSNHQREALQTPALPLELPVRSLWTRRESNSPHSPCKGVSPAIGTCEPIFGLHSYKAFAETNPARGRKTGILAFPNYKFVA